MTKTWRRQKLPQGVVMIRQNRARSVPYMALSAALLGCALFFAVTLWRGESLGESGDLAYTPGFDVRADVVNSVRVVPLAGPALRSPSVNMDKNGPVSLAY
jgi:hypothetical protein